MNDETPSRVDNYRITGRSGVKPMSYAGFTIVETMVVLAITGLLLFIALLFFAGQERKVEFNQSVRDIQSVIQQTINEVGTGFYPSGSDFQCTQSGVNLSITHGASTQGSNTDCIFLGKAIQFAVSGTAPQEYNIFTIAGLKNNSGSIVTAKPTVVNIPSAKVNTALHSGLRVVSMTYKVGASLPIPIGALAFVGGLGDYSSGLGVASGAQQMSLIPVATSTLNATEVATISSVNGSLATSPPDPSGGVQICFASGGTIQSGLITIGSNGRSLSVKLDIKSTVNCT